MLRDLDETFDGKGGRNKFRPNISAQQIRMATKSTNGTK
jgi:hypothetical protein